MSENNIKWVIYENNNYLLVNHINLLTQDANLKTILYFINSEYFISCNSNTCNICFTLVTVNGKISEKSDPLVN